MAGSTPIQLVLNALSDTRKVPPENIKDAVEEFNDRLECLAKDYKDRFQNSMLNELLDNVGTEQYRSAKAKLPKANVSYNELCRLTHQYKRPGPPANHESQGGQPEPHKAVKDTKKPDVKQNDLEGSERSRADANAIGKQASYLMKNNPSVADLSDPNRPTKTAERYSELYDNEWTEAFEELTKFKVSEEKSIHLLFDVITGAYTYCKELADLQIKQMIVASKDILRTGNAELRYDEGSSGEVRLEDREPLAQYRKQKAALSLKKIKEGFSTKATEILHKYNLPAQSDKSAFQTYARKCSEITWWMCVQVPPITMSDLQTTPPTTAKRTFDSNKYRAYTKVGQYIGYLVWPCLRLHETGPILCKGVAQGV